MEGHCWSGYRCRTVSSSSVVVSSAAAAEQDHLCFLSSDFHLVALLSAERPDGKMSSDIKLVVSGDQRETAESHRSLVSEEPGIIPGLYHVSTDAHRL